MPAGLGPALSAPPRFNHVAMSVPPDLLDAGGRAAICEFYGDVFGFEQYDVMTVDRERLVLGAHLLDQFVYVVAQDEPMHAHRHDHYGMAVETRADFDAILERAEAWKAKRPDDVVLDGPMQEEHHGFVRIHNFYVTYLLPLTIEVQLYEQLT